VRLVANAAAQKKRAEARTNRRVPDEVGVARMLCKG
jgi:hypothetical protein